MSGVGTGPDPAGALEELATLLAHGYIRSLASKAVPVAGNGAPEPEIGLDDAGRKSVHVGGPDGPENGERP